MFNRGTLGLLLLCVAVANARVQIRFNQSLVEVYEGSSDFSFRLLALGTFERNFSVNIMFEAKSAREIEDYFPLTYEANFTVGSSESSDIKVLMPEDNAWEGMEVFKVTFSIPDGIDAEKGLPAAMTVGIKDDDNVLVSFDSSDMMVKEGEGDVVLRLKSSNPYTVPFTVFVRCFEVHPVQAKQGFIGRNDIPNADFVVQDHMVRFTDVGGQNTVSSSITIKIVDDRLSESTESFICIILKPFLSNNGITVQNPDTITISIEDNDFLWVHFERLLFGGAEGETAAVQLKADGEFDDPFSAEIFVHNLVGVANEAQAGVDYLAPREMIGQGIVDFVPNSHLGKLSTPLLIQLHKDGIVETTEYFGIDFTIESDDMRTLNIAKRGRSARVAIVDRDEMLVRFSSPNYTVDESETTLEVTLKVVVPHHNISGEYEPAKHSIEVKVTLKTQDGSAKDGQDYESTEGIVTFYPGMSMSTPFTINLRDNAVPEGAEEFKIQIEVENPWNSRVKLLQSETTVTIKDDDFATVTFEMDKYETMEDSMLRAFLVSNKQFQDDQLFVIGALNGTAFVTEDFRLIDPTVRMRKGQRRSEAIRVRIVDDNIVEDVESFKLVLNIPEKAVKAGALYGEPRIVNVAVEDDDKVTVGFPEVDDPEDENKTVVYTVGEGDGEYHVDLSVVDGTVFKPFNVTVRAVRNRRANATAKEWTDFYVDGETNVLQFGVGETKSTKAVIRIVDDYVCEGPESFSLQATIDSKTAQKVKLSAFDRLPITIIDNEGPCEEPDVPTLVSFDTDIIEAEESDKPITIQVIRLGKLDKPLRVQLRTEDLTAEEGEDYMLDSDEVRFTNQNSVFETKPVKVLLHADGKKETPEGFRIILDGPDNAVYQQRDISVVIRDE